MRIASSIFFVALIAAAALAEDKPAPSWISASNEFTQQLVKVENKHDPENGSRQGLSEYDELVSQPTLADEEQERKEQKEVAQDLEIIIRRVELNFRLQDYQRAHDVPFTNASSVVFSGVRMLLDAQTPTARRPAAVVRLRLYAGLDPAYKPL